jgi:putative oxidoreductase
MRALLIDVGLLVLRVGIGCLMLFGHGLGKLQGFDQMRQQFADPFGLGMTVSLVLAIAAEVGCSALLIPGLFTRLATLPLIVTMLVAIFHVHGEHPWVDKERAVLYLLIYVTLALTGPGRMSLDGAIRLRRSWSRTPKT